MDNLCTTISSNSYSILSNPITSNMAAIDRGKHTIPTGDRPIDVIDFYMMYDALRDIRREVNNWLHNLRGYNTDILCEHIQRARHLYRFIVTSSLPNEWSPILLKTHVNYLMSLDKFTREYMYFSDLYIYSELENGVLFVNKMMKEIEPNASKFMAPFRARAAKKV